MNTAYSLLKFLAHPRLEPPSPARVFFVLMLFVRPLLGVANEFGKGSGQGVSSGSIIIILAAVFAAIGIFGMYRRRSWGWRMVGVSIGALAFSLAILLLSHPWAWKNWPAYAFVIALVLVALEMYLLAGRSAAHVKFVTDLVNSIGSESASERKLRELRQLSPERALPGYSALLHSSNSSERIEAAIAVARSGRKAAVPQLTHILVSNQPTDLPHRILAGLRLLDAKKTEPGFHQAMITSLRRRLRSEEPLEATFVEVWLVLHRDSGQMQSGADELIKSGLIQETHPDFVALLKLLNRFRVSFPGLIPPEPGIFNNNKRMELECAIMENIGLRDPVGMLQALEAKLALRVAQLKEHPKEYCDVELEITASMLHLHGLDSHKIWISLLDKLRGGDMNSLSEVEQNYYAVFNMQADLDNGGWGGYLGNCPDEVDIAIRGAMAMGAEHDAHQLREFKKRLDAYVPADEDDEPCIYEIEKEVFKTEHPPIHLHTHSMCHLYALKNLAVFGGKAPANLPG